jgi:hypothetical protein
MPTSSSVSVRTICCTVSPVGLHAAGGPGESRARPRSHAWQRKLAHELSRPCHNGELAISPSNTAAGPPGPVGSRGPAPPHLTAEVIPLPRLAARTPARPRRRPGRPVDLERRPPAGSATRISARRQPVPRVPGPARRPARGRGARPGGRLPLPGARPRLPRASQPRIHGVGMRSARRCRRSRAPSLVCSPILVPGSARVAAALTAASRVPRRSGAQLARCGIRGGSS